MPPLNMWTAIDRLDRDIIIASWHYGYTVDDHYPESYPMIPWLAGKGFCVVGVPWFKTDGMVNMARDVSDIDGLGMMGSSWALCWAVRDARGQISDSERAKISSRKELGVLAATAETAWSPQTAENALGEYDPEAWEKRWIK